MHFHLRLNFGFSAYFFHHCFVVVALEFVTIVFDCGICRLPQRKSMVVVASNIVSKNIEASWVNDDGHNNAANTFSEDEST